MKNRDKYCLIYDYAHIHTGNENVIKYFHKKGYIIGHDENYNLACIRPNEEVVYGYDFHLLKSAFIDGGIYKFINYINVKINKNIIIIT